MIFSVPTSTPLDDAAGAVAEEIAQEIESEAENYFGEQASHWAEVYAKIAREVGAADV